VVDLAVGQSHVVAVTRAGWLYGWGRNDEGQLGAINNNNNNSLFNSVVVPTPTRLTVTSSNNNNNNSNNNSHNNNNNNNSHNNNNKAGQMITGYVGVACGPKTTVAWPGGLVDNSAAVVLPLHIPFVLEADNGDSFRLLDSLLADIWPALSGANLWPPRQESLLDFLKFNFICAVFVLRFQFYSCGICTTISRQESRLACFLISFFIPAVLVLNAKLKLFSPKRPISS
jgi:hypothetical protein